MLWVYLLLVSIQKNEGAAPHAPTVCQGTGQPCVEFITHSRSYCYHYDMIRQRIEYRTIPDGDETEHPWWIEKGLTKKLCCDVKVSEPMLIDTLRFQWFYYDTLSMFGADNFTILQDDIHYTMEETVRPMLEGNRKRAIGVLVIKEAAYSSSGAYACQVLVNTTAAKGYSPLEIGRISEPFVINVYSERLAFADEDYQREVELSDYQHAPYTFIRYKLQPVNPDKKLMMSIDTDESFFQYIDIRSRSSVLITPYGDLETSESSYQKDFTVNFFYEDEEENKVSRTWTIEGPAYTPLATHKVIAVTDEESEQGAVVLGKVFPVVVLGSCNTFRYKVKIGGGDKTELVFDPTFPDTFKSIEDGKATLEYKFTDKRSSGDLAKTNAYVELILSRNDHYIDEQNKNTQLRIFVSCDNEGAEDTELLPSWNFKGLPYFPEDLRSPRNCLSYNQTSPAGYYGSASAIISRRQCCETQGKLYNNVYLWRNGKKLSSEEYVIGPLYPTMYEDMQAYPWFEEFAGYYQCIVGEYQYDVYVGPRPEGLFYTRIKARTYKIGFDIGGLFNESLEIDLSQSTSFLEKGADVTKYNVKLGKFDLLVVAGSCVGLLVQGVSFPQSTIAWKAQELDLFYDKGCKERQTPYKDAQTLEWTGKTPNTTYTYTPYDKVKIEWRLYAGRAIDSNGTYVSATMSTSATSVRIIAKTPYLDTPAVEQSRHGNTVIIINTVTCTVAGYPLDSVTLYSVNENSESVLQRFELGHVTEDVPSNLVSTSRDGYRVVLQLEQEQTQGVKQVRCTAVNSLLLGSESEKHFLYELKDRKNSTLAPWLIGLIVAALILVVIVVVVLLCIRRRCCGGERYLEVQTDTAQNVYASPPSYRKVEEVEG